MPSRRALPLHPRTTPTQPNVFLRPQLPPVGDDVAGPAPLRGKGSDDEASPSTEEDDSHLVPLGEDHAYLLPTVVAPFAVRPGEPPRRVQVERRRMLYQSLDLAAHLRRGGASAPALHHAPGGAGAGSRVLELADCDDTLRETREPSAWVPSGSDLPPAPAQRVTMEGGFARIEPCEVMGHLPPAQEGGPARFLVRPPGSSEEPTVVPRLGVCFDAENPTIFGDRVLDALRWRAATEDGLLARLIADCMPTDDVGGMGDDALRRVLDLASSAERYHAGRESRVTDSFRQGLLEEVETDYRTAVNRMVLERVWSGDGGPGAADAGSGASSSSAGRSKSRAIDTRLVVPLPVPPAGRAESWAAPARGCVPVPRYDFGDRFSEFCFHTLLTSDEVLKALSEIRRENSAVLRMGLFNLSALGKTARLDELQQAQDQECGRVVSYLQESWTTKIKNVVRATFRGVGKGWFHLEESNRDTYEFSKLKKFQTLVRVLMQDTLRTLVEESLSGFVEAVELACSAEVIIKSAGDAAVAWPDATPRGARHALVSVDLEPRQRPATAAERPGGWDFACEPDVARILPTFLGIFDRAASSVSGIPQIEQQIMDKMFWASQGLLAVPSPGEPHIRALRVRLVEALEKALVPVRAYLGTWERYVPTVELDVDKRIHTIETTEGFGLEVCREEIDRSQVELRAAQEELSILVGVGICKILTKPSRDAVVLRKQKLVAGLKELVATVPRRMMLEATKGFEAIFRQLRVATTSVEDVDKMRRFIQDMPIKIAELTQAMEQSEEWYAEVETMMHRVRDEDARVHYQALNWPRRLAATAKETLLTLEDDESKFRDEMRGAQRDFAVQMDELEGKVAALASKSDHAQLIEMDREVTKIHKQLTQALLDAQLFSSREALLFGSATSDYSSVRKLFDSFDPFYQFWHTAGELQAQHNNWMNESWEELVPDKIEQQVTQAFKVFYKCGRVFQQRGLPDIAALAEEKKGFADDFKRFVPLIYALRQPGMKDRHWQTFSKSIGRDFAPDASFTLGEAAPLLESVDDLVNVADVAAKEFSIEQALAKMKGEWDKVNLDVMEYGETGTFIVKVEDVVLQQLDDHLVMTQSMSFSPHKAPFEAEIADWEKSLRLMSDMVDEWMQLQRQWMYLQPIFASEDIQEQLPVEAKKFTQVDRMWRRALAEAKARPHMLTVCTNKTQLGQFVDANKHLDTVQKGLSDYLETKRLAFARFFFLSDGDILQILSQTRNPLAVQDHLSKCFEGIDRLIFQDDLEITGMTSREGESVQLAVPTHPRGNVEQWLGNVERCMFESIRAQTSKSIQGYETTHRKQWVLEWPGMCVLAVSSIFWARSVETAIEESKLQDYADHERAEILDLTDLVRGKLSKLQRITLGALITIDVHARDVVESLVSAGVKDVRDFEWASQLRYYWRTPPGGDAADGDVTVDMVQASLPYGYEYLGNGPRLVITPLTDRCYMTLMSAMHQNLGGAPAGPAGTGKTETTKDLAKALAKKCLVFNCSDGLDHHQLGKFFKGLASAGSWACFDEFNRIDLEVLSVVATQIDTIQRAIQRQEQRFVFEDTELNLDPSCAVFITMNPGYAGRSELPDNLKALFRPCAMMVPDYALIAEISLYAYGYRNAKPLSKKMVATFTLCSEQLSAQKHYDYGMRAVKSTITAAGNLKGEFPDADEEYLVLRGLRDINVPKFLSHDLPLFEGIISDLFPGVERPATDYTALVGAIKKACASLDLQATDHFVLKVIELYETTVVRHGLMLVGPTMGGKTCCYRVLARAMTSLRALAKENESSGFERVESVVLNPKAILAGQLYGQFDKNTAEWTDGVLSHYMREFTEKSTPDKKWIMFDGPVDAVWIEDMNTVLDDNKKLCLVSGATIPLTDSMTMMFEVDNLEEASPATVSRCGMVYLESKSLGVDPLFASWLGGLPSGFNKYTKTMQSGFDLLVKPLIDHVRRNLKETVPTEDSNLTASFLHVYSSLLERYRRSEGKEDIDPEVEKRVDVLVPAFLLLATTWSVGAVVDGPSRAKFDSRFRELAVQVPGVPAGAIPPVAAEGVEDYRTIFEFMIDEETLAWRGWMDTIPNFTLDPRTPFTDIIVPTPDSVSCSFFMGKLMASHRNVLCVGQTGTGKTVTVTQKLMSLPEGWEPQMLTFSARTSANQTQDLLDGKVDKLRKVGETVICAPPSGKRYAILVDDLNMPLREKYGAQPPIELLRQWMDHGGWYERVFPFSFRQIEKVQFVGSMGPPGGGRNPVTPRFLRHFNYLSFVEMSDKSVATIFATIIGTSLRARGFPEGVASLDGALVTATIEMYNTIRAELLPTPSKSHYTFNMRDMSRVVQGFLRADPAQMTIKAHALTLWLHESARVYRDRLVNQSDCDWFDEKADALLKKHFETSMKDIVTTERLIYGDFLVPGADPKVYQQVNDIAHLFKIVDEALEDHNSMSNSPMNLILFLDAIEHVSRVCRVIQLPLGNMLLLGVGGSGRQSLARLASAMEEFSLFSIEIVKGYGQTEWRADLKAVLKRAGKDAADTVFLLTDTQIVQESFLEDINNILNAGEVPNLMELEDIEEIVDALTKPMVAEGLQVTPRAALAFFTKRVRQHLHCVICMSPVGEAFRRRLRMFPALVNCCIIDWFHEWPDEALRSVAQSKLADVALGAAGNSDEEQARLMDGVVRSFVVIHQSVERQSVAFREELRRFNYVTPTSYLELLGTFSSLLDVKRKEILEGRRRLQIGLEKLAGAQAIVTDLQKEIIAKQPELERTSKEVDDLLVVIDADTKKADETRAVVAVQEAEATVQANASKAIKDEAEGQLAEAIPALEEAVRSLNELEVKDVQEVRAFNNPPRKVILVMEAICVMFGDKGEMRDNPDTGKKERWFWKQAQKRLQDPRRFLASLLEFDKDNIPDKVIDNILPYIQNPDFMPAEIAAASKACTAMCKWVRSMHTYHGVNKRVEPLRIQLAEAEGKYSATMAVLNTAQAQLKAAQDKIDELQRGFASANAKKDALQKELNACQVRLDRADKLIGGLGGEKLRWEGTVEQLGRDLVNVVGDVVVASGSIGYLGPFTPAFRARMLDEWRRGMTEIGVPHTKGATLSRILDDPVQTREWTIAGLPSDAMSIENAIILSKSRRWPLFIDPQGQASKWIRNLEASKIDLVKASDRDFLRPLENGLRFGRVILLEGCAESLDPALEPILLKQTFKQGGQEVIKVGDNVIPCSPDFRFYMTTKLRNPHYAPEVSVKVTLLNFFVTPEGLEDQLLNVVVTEERPDLAEMKTHLMISNTQMRKELKAIEDRILELLSASSGDILEDEVLINTLSKSKVTSNEITSKVAEAEKTEKEIDTTRELYRPVALRASLLFFAIADMGTIDPMYQYSLTWFIALFLNSIAAAEKSDNVELRVSNLNSGFTYATYVAVCRSLFERHKTTYSFMSLARIMAAQKDAEGRSRIDEAEWRLFLAGPSVTATDVPKPAEAGWLTDQAWVELWNLDQLPSFSGLLADVASHLDHYRELFDAAESHRHPMTEPWQTKLSSVQKLLFLRAVRPDKVVPAIRDLISEELGARFVEPPPFDLAASYAESTPASPLVFVLSPGADPMSDLWKLAEELKMSKRFEQVSLGKGQGPKAAALVKDAMESGKWVCLQNCHLASSWMGELEELVESINLDTVNPHFRLWLTALPSEDFPVSILQDGVKMTLEPPAGLKANLVRSYQRFDNTVLEGSAAWRRLLFGLCLFHAVVQDRRKYGPLGWNIKYDFTDGDLNISMTQMRQYLDEGEEIPFRVIRFLASEINYGGRVTDDKDRRLIGTLLQTFVNERVPEDGYAFSSSGVYRTTDAREVRDYLGYIAELPLTPNPDIFGLSENADITCDQNETFSLLDTVLSLQPRTSGGAGASREDVVEDKCNAFLARVPSPFDVEAVAAQYPVKYDESMNTVLQQECIRYNALLDEMSRTLRDTVKAVRGLVVMSADLEQVADAVFDNRVPAAWERKAYPSLKPLSSWMDDLLERTGFIAKWIECGPPPAFWISGFFFPQAFLTGTLQNHARARGIAIDTVSFAFEIMDDVDPAEGSGAKPPSTGCYVYGMHLEGARWDTGLKSLAESRPKELFTELPVVWLRPEQNRTKPTSGSYDCPVYKTLERKGTLSTTGHSTNYVMSIEMPTTSRDASHWTRRGVALFTALAR